MSEEATRLVPGGGDSEAGNGDAPGRADIQDDSMVVDVEAEADSRDKQASTSLRPPPRKRRRTVISCTQCHRRKQKCDRKLPCANCITRHKQDGCEYESDAPTARELQKHRNAEDGAFSVRVAARPGDNDSHWRGTPADGGSASSSSSKPVNFGYSHTGASTLGFLQKLEDAQSPLSHLNPDNMGRGDHFNTRERYKTLIRQLPARIYIDKLVDIYFVEFNWQYQSLDRDAFDKQLQEWYRLPFNLLTTGGPQALDPHLRAFPALLFQVLALALLLLHSEADQVFESLKYAGNMTFDDLAMDYSESGMSILSLLGKRQMTITTVQTGFLRASFLKYVALVTESWHAIGSAIRDGQEIGLHRDSLDPKPANNSPEAILENQWAIQRRRKLWITLVWWDLHAAVVLGRPTTIDLSQEQQLTLPIDAKMNILATSSPSSSSSLPNPLVPRTESDPPTPLTRLIFAIALGTQLRTIYTLEKTLGPNPHSFNALDSLHAEFLSLESQTPPWLRLENPDTKFDSLPECYWIPYARAQMPQMLAFNIMALHRPYIFTRPKSRTEALKASLGMLQAQRYHFSTLRPEHYKMFTLFFGTFDAIVIVAAVFILFSREFGRGEYVDGAVRQFGWAVERFRAMSGRNGLARAALGVLKVLGVRFVRALGLKEDVIFGLGEHVAKEVVERVPPPVTNAGLMPLPWGASDGDGGSAAAAVTEGGVRTTTPLTYGSGGPGPSSVSPAAAGGAGAMLVADYYTAMKSTLQQTHSNDGRSASPSNNGSGHTTHTPQARDATTTMAGSGTATSYNAPSTSSMDTTPSTTVGGGSSTTTDNRTILLDPPGTSGGGGSWDSNNWNTINIPSDFDWSSLQPIFATGDLLYNDLQLHSTDGGGGAGWGSNTTGNDGNGNNLGTTSSGGGSGPDIFWTSGAGSVPFVPAAQSISHVNMDNTAAGPSGGGMHMAENRGNNHNSSHDVGASVEHKQGLTDQGNNNNMNPWLLDGDFGGHSFWSLLNQFGPPAPPPPGT
ncbi:hypothetical protein V8F33_004362 [Rhypophila sp. PSN 637]